MAGGVSCEWRPKEGAFRGWHGHTLAGRHHLFLAHACPWSQRVLIARRLKGLEGTVGTSFVRLSEDEQGWAFTGGERVDELHGWRRLDQAYSTADPGFRGDVTVPVLWDRLEGTIVNTESADLVRMLNAWGKSGPDLYPAPLREEIDAVGLTVEEGVTKAVYRVGHAADQVEYEEEFTALFETLAELDQRLGHRRYLVGNSPTEADWRLFSTLVRFDAVYYTLFRCNGRRLVDYRNLWPYARDLYQVPGVAATVRMDEIKRHYYRAESQLNPLQIVPSGPLGVDWGEPHRRGDLASEPNEKERR
ncbi:MAG: glutathione S-transferase C-terminal domain-containing protein [Actinobacteria bacterium]|nr:glutathione S-transferase C-terminal domain-containing protein [Actinomycetota bacterium]